MFACVSSHQISLILRVASNFYSQIVWQLNISNLTDIQYVQLAMLCCSFQSLCTVCHMRVK